MKVQDLARELGQRPKELMRFLSEVAIKVKSPTTKLDDATVQIIRELYDEQHAGKKKKKKVLADDGSKIIYLKNANVQVKDLAKTLHTPLSEIMKVLLTKGLLLTLNSEIDIKMAMEIAKHFDVEVEIDDANEDADGGDAKIREHLETIEDFELEHDEDRLVTRPPVITIMGHVDHGKTSLLDTIRKTNVTEKEAGGITQHIGAYQIIKNGRRLTFLDTPGHEAFTTLRARGAQVTDIAILVVAAEEGVKPQTIEAINHAKAAKVPVIVAINKVDRPDANPDRVKQMLADYGLVAEEWGGTTVMVPVSARSGVGIDELLDLIVLTADMLELKAIMDVPAKGIVIESRLSKTKGPVATILVKSGTLRVGDSFVIGATSGKIRALLNEYNQPVTEAGAGTPVEILGISEVPRPGDLLDVLETEKVARKIATGRSDDEKRLSSSRRSVSFENLSQQIESGEVGRLNLIIKADVNGSLEAVIGSIEQVSTDEISVTILHAATGPITENDIMLARASSALVIGFGVGINSDAETLASEEGIKVRFYSIIYEIIDDVRKVIKGLYKVEYEEVELGKAEVRQLFKFSRVGVIAGSYVQSGKMLRNSLCKVFRDGKPIHDSKLTSLKRFKEDVREVLQGYECGIVFEDFTDIVPGDIISCYEMKEKSI